MSTWCRHVHVIFRALAPRRSEWLTLETSAFESLHGGQVTLSTQLIKPNYLVIRPPTQHHSFFRNLPPLFVCWTAVCPCCENSKKRGKSGRWMAWWLVHEGIIYSSWESRQVGWIAQSTNCKSVILVCFTAFYRISELIHLARYITLSLILG